MLGTIVIGFIAVVALLVYLLKNYVVLYYKTTSLEMPPLWFAFKHRLELPEKLYEFVTKHKPKDFYRFLSVNKFSIIAVTPDAAKFVLGNRDAIVKDFAANLPPSSHTLFSNNVVSADGADWRRQKLLYSSAFGKEAYKSYFPTFSTLTNKCLVKLEENRQAKGDVEMTELLSHFTLDVLGLTIFGYDFKSLDGKIDDYYHSYKTVFQLASKPILLLAPWLEKFSFGPGFANKQNTDKMRELFNKMIIDNKKTDTKTAEKAILTHLIQASDSEEEGLTQTELLSNAFILFVAGHETTASALSWLLYELSLHKDVQDKLYEEIVSTIGVDKDPTMEDLDKMSYLDMTINESLRLNPPLSLLNTRKTTTPLKYNDIDIPAGVSIGIDIGFIHKDPTLWRDPLEFQPEHFSPENKKGMHRFAFLPFSLGPRQCIGNMFSLIEQHLFIVRILQKYEIHVPKNHQNTVKREAAGVNAMAKLYLDFKPRVSA